MGEKIGYARLRIRKHNIFSQENALNTSAIFIEKISGKELKRECLAARFTFVLMTLLSYSLWKDQADSSKNA